MERCVRCHIRENEVRLFDAVCNGQMDKICERCSIIENIPIIRKPTSPQLKESEKSIGVYERMKRLIGISSPQTEKTFFRGDRLKELDNNPGLEHPEGEPLDLIEHYHWQITRNRRKKGLSQKQLAEALGESEILIQMIEKAQLSLCSYQLIRKLEQFFRIRLRKMNEMERIYLGKVRKPVLLNEYGQKLDVIPEPKIESPIKNEEIDEIESSEEDNFNTEEPVQDLDIKNINPSKLRIGNLRNLYRRKIEATRQEKIEEQKKIEEKQRIVEARKEELRLMREKESRELDKVLGGSELLGKRKSDNFNNLNSVEEFDEELI